MYKDLEFVCGGNLGRSPIEAAVARCELLNRGHYFVNVNSSGTAVDFMKTATEAQVQKAALQYLPIMTSKGIITPEQEKDLREGKNVKLIVSPILEELSDKELDRVKEILMQKKLVRYGDIERLRHPKQTVVRDNAELILVNGQRNLQLVQSMYAPTNYKPIIENLGEFEDPFFMSIEQHGRLAKKLEVATVEAIERFYK